MFKVKIKSIAYKLPKTCVTNYHEKFARLSKNMKFPPEYWGIDSRYHIDKETSESEFELALDACRQAMQAANIRPNDIDMLVCSATAPVVSGINQHNKQRQERFFPRLADDLRHALDIKALAFDTEHECGAFVLNLQIAASYIKSGRCRNILICSSEHVSRVLDFTSSSGVIFGDCATAAVISRSDSDADLLCSFFYSNPEHYEVATLQWRLAEQPDENDPLQPYFTLPGDSPEKMQSFVPAAVPRAVKEVLKKANMSVEDIRFFVFHQPSAMIVSAWANYIGVADGGYSMNMDKNGCMVAASVPFTLHQAIKDKQVQAGDTIIISSAAIGWSFGAQIWKVDDIIAA